jgi:DNA-binding beta-propeller fold protein YncE
MTLSMPGVKTRSVAPARTTDVGLVRTGFIPIPPGSKPGFDHADVHRKRRRLYVAHTGADRIDVIDCEARAYLGALPVELPGVAGVLIDEEHDRLFSSDRGAARISVFRCADEQLLGQTEVGPHPNGLAYDRRRRRLYSFNLGDPVGKNCSASVVDVASRSLVVELPLPGRPRWALYDPHRDVVYANIQQPAQIVVLNCGRAAIERAFEVPSAGPHGLWLDSGRLFCAADGGNLVILDSESGEVRASLPLPGVPDVVMHDPELKRLYVAIGDPGLVCSFDSERLEQVETVETEQGAHTTGWDPIGGALYVFSPDSGGAAVYEERA